MNQCAMAHPAWCLETLLRIHSSWQEILRVQDLCKKVSFQNFRLSLMAPTEILSWISGKNPMKFTKKISPRELSQCLELSLNNQFLMDVWSNNHFQCKDFESSNWNNHKELVVWSSRWSLWTHNRSTSTLHSVPLWAATEQCWFHHHGLSLASNFCDKFKLGKLNGTNENIALYQQYLPSPKKNKRERTLETHPPTFPSVDV